MDLSGFTPEFQAALGPFLAARPGIGINSGTRTPEEQAQIIADNWGKFSLDPGARGQWLADVASMGAIPAGKKWEPVFSSATRVVGGQGEYGTPFRNWIALPGSSNHQRGLAADLSFASADDKAWAHASAGEYGLNFPLSNEAWHIEPVGARGGVMAGAAPGPTAPQGAGTPTGPGNVLAAAPDGTGGQDETMQKLALFNALRGRGQQQQDPRAFMSQPNALAILPFTNRIG